MDINKALLILKNTIISKKKFCFIKKNNQNKKLLTTLATTGILLFNDNASIYKVTISPIYLKTRIIMTISLKTSQKQIWPKSKIFKNTQNSTTIFIFETPFGFLTQSAMLKKKIGGIFICSICF